MVPAQVEAIERLVAEQRFDAVAISGDLTQRARTSEYKRAAAFLQAVERTSPAIAVPGNHDVRWWFAPLHLGRRAAMFGAWQRALRRPIEPVLRVPGVTLVGLNTSQGITPRTLTWNMRDLSVIGDLRPAQVKWAAAQFGGSPAGDARVIVMHHNPVKGELSRRHGLKHTPQILGAFADIDVDVVLCGHDHQEAIHEVLHTRRGTIVSTAGTVSSRSRGGRPSSVNVIDIGPAEISVHAMVWTPGTGAFHDGPSRCFAR
ncbi:MAG: metallophosphoesterase [Gemmatimonadetes bacterium]|nr:metallophosphoesterase [Gemmatimonadota bacterium]